jgi:hypothetical protein
MFATKIPKNKEVPLTGRGTYPWEEWLAIAEGEAKGDQYEILAENLPNTNLESFRNAVSAAGRERGVAVKTRMDYKKDEKGEFLTVNATDKDGKVKKGDDGKPVKIKVPERIVFQAFAATDDGDSEGTE